MGQDSILGQVLESQQMWTISTEGLEQVFLCKTNKSDFLCISSQGSASSGSDWPAGQLPHGRTPPGGSCPGPEPVALLVKSGSIRWCLPIPALRGHRFTLAARRQTPFRGWAVCPGLCHVCSSLQGKLRVIGTPYSSQFCFLSH